MGRAVLAVGACILAFASAACALQTRGTAGDGGEARSALDCGEGGVAAGCIRMLETKEPAATPPSEANGLSRARLMTSDRASRRAAVVPGASATP